MRDGINRGRQVVGRRRALLTCALLVAALGADAARAPERQWTTRAAIHGVHLYQGAMSPRLARLGARCRFTPSCSHYAEVALQKHGIVRGGWLAMRRVARCGPWTPAGTIDPVP